ncbi:MAG: ABC transporter ATP-binding protein [Clostridiales bacterium]|nr:ABC transporter ATP-binding protein [Clostridiales bacterium]
MKPFAVMIFIAILLLFVQNLTELALPNYMSEIVNTGIMRNGIEDDVPEVMSADALRLVTSFMTQDDRNIFESGYTQYKPGSGETLLEKYPGLEGISAFTRTQDEKESAVLAAVYGKAVYALSEYMKAQFGAQGGTVPDDISENDGPKPADMDISKMDVTALYVLLENIDQQAAANAIEEAGAQRALFQTEVGVTFTRLFYKELGANLSKIQLNSILSIGFIMLLISLVSVVAAIIIGFLSSKVSMGIGRKLRHDIFKKVGSFSPTEFDKFSTASLITRSTNDVQQVQMFSMMSIRMMCSAPIMGIGGVIMAVNKSLSMSWIIAVAVVLLLILQIIMFSMVVPKFKMMQKLIDKLNLVARENLSGMMVIRAFGNEEKEAGRFEEANRKIRNTHRFVQRTMAVMQPTLNFLMGCTTLLIVWIGGHQVAISKLQIGDMLAFLQYATQIIMTFLMISMMFIMIPRALVSAGRIKEVLDTDPQIKDKEKVKTLNGKSKGKVVFKNVSFKYHDAEDCVLTDISFTAVPGQTTAFIGSTGSGKSTLINLIPRFYDVTEGVIEIDGIDIRDLTQAELRANLGYVPQKGVLFSGDIGSNLSFGKEDATPEEYLRAIQVAQAEDFVFNQKEGLDSEIAQGGDNVSGGQKQRLSIARALIRDPSIYIFDDSFSALDFKTDAALRKALRTYTSDATVFIVAQRVSTIMNADQIIVLDAGRIVGKGTHSELLISCKEYREIAESQLSKEELA